MAGAVERVVVVADEPVARRGLRLVLEDAGIPALDVETLERASRLARGRTGVVLLVLGRALGPEEATAIDAIRRDQPEIGVCLVVDVANRNALSALTADGCSGLGAVIRPSAEIDQILDAIHAAASGRVLIPASMRETATRTHDHRLEQLSAYEREVLELMAEGLRNPAIAKRLWKSEKAIEKTVARVFGKLGLHAEFMPDVDRRVTAARIYLSSLLPLQRPTPVETSARLARRYSSSRA